MLEMPVNVFNMHNHVLAYFARAWRPKLGALTAQHDSALRNSQLRMGDAGAGTRSAQPLRETECAAEPFDRLLHVFVHEDGYHSCFRRRLVDYHRRLLDR